ncbi:MAG: hypothetical protein CME63_13035 [Halobacteriovoraceae bacterium]|nr:hypothetical protein [Halobacteriovoraceae bacterium]
MHKDKIIFYLSPNSSKKKFDQEIKSLFEKGKWDAEYKSYFEDPSRKGLVFCSKDEVDHYNRASLASGVIILYSDGELGEEVESLDENFGDFIKGYLDDSKLKTFGPRLIKSLIQDKLLDSTVEDTQEHLGKVLEQSLLELQRVKKLHEKVVPMRQEKLKGVTVFSKFAAGFSSGGEFFDIKKSEKELVIMLTSTQSYVASSVILGPFEEFQKNGDSSKEGIEDFLENLIDECRSLDLISREDYELLQLDIIRLDLRTYEYEGFHFGKGCYYSDGVKKISSNTLPINENSFEQSYFHGVLRRGQKLIYVSPGAFQNYAEKGQKDKIETVILEQFKNGAREILNEAFFQLKKDNEEDFLKYDASIIYLEVDPNAFIQV